MLLFTNETIDYFYVYEDNIKNIILTFINILKKVLC